MKVSNRTFVISGGSSGLGLATSYNLAEAGALIAVFDLRENPGQIEKLGNRVKFFKVDVTKDNDIEHGARSVVEWTKSTEAILGGVINCAGGGIPAKIIDSKRNMHTLEHWNSHMAVNLTGAFNLTRHVVKYLVDVPSEEPDGERGNVIFVSSMAAFDAQAGMAAYAAAKGALVSITLPLARDLARNGIRVNTLAPGVFTSPLTDRFSARTTAGVKQVLTFPARFGKAHEFAQAVRFILETGYVNGDVLKLSAATRMSPHL